MSSPNSAQEGGGPGYIDSLDAKIIQYQYCIRKIQRLIPGIQKLGEDAARSKELPLVQYAVLLCGSIFAINEGVFNTKLDIIGDFKIFKAVPITISNVVTHIPYDNPDLSVKPLSEVPTLEMGIKSLKALEELCYTCLQGYQKRLQQAKIAKEKLTASGGYFDDLENLLTNQIFSKYDVDLTLGNGLLHQLPEDPTWLEDENYVEAYLTDMDIEMVFTFTSQIRSTLSHLKLLLIPFQKLRTVQKQQQDQYLKTLSDGKYALHKILMLTLRLNELYTILRKIGRKIYFSNYQHLYDNKLAFQSSNSNYFRLNLLKDIDDLFNSTKKNGTLVANLTRFVRPNSKYELTCKNVLDFSNFVSQAYIMIESTTDKFEEFGFNWISSELRFRKVYGLPKKNLIDVFNKVKESNKKPNEENQKQNSSAPPKKLIANNSKSSELASDKKITPEGSGSSDKLEAFPEINESGPKSLELELKKLNLGDLLPTRGSRSSSVSSTSSNSSNRKLPVNSMLKNVSSSQNNRNPALPQKMANTIGQRPNSMIFMNSNPSLNNLQTTSRNEAKTATTTTPSGRRRSTSLPLSPRISIVSDNTQKATSGAAAALARSNSLRSQLSPARSPSGSISSPGARSPSGSIKRLASQTKSSNGIYNSQISSPSPTSKQKPLIVVQEESDSDTTSSATKPLTANQRLQLHLRQATKSGALMTQQKEVLTSVVFDPSDPSSVGLRKSVENTPVETTSQSPTREQTITSPPTRDQVTRRNTRRNSVTPQLGNPPSTNNSSVTTINAQNTSTSSVSSNSSGSNSINAPVKKVRFTGVPEYSELEDAPTTYANRLLKNFAVFKAPQNKPGFKRKDQILRAEESLSLKSHLSDSTAGVLSPPPQTGMSKFRNKLL